MIAITALLFALGSTDSPTLVDTSVVAPAGPTVSAARVLAPADTAHRRRKAVEVSDNYELRLRVHRYTAYLVPALFAVQYTTGQKLFDQYFEGKEAGDWVRPVHKANAWALAGAFTVNTVTGAWNLWDTRHQEEGRTLRILHTLSMIAADGVFAYAGTMIDAESGVPNDRRRHRTLALTGMGITVASGAVMLIAK